MKQVMNAAVIASLFACGLIACAPSSNPKARGLKPGTGTVDAQKLNVQLQKVFNHEPTDADKELQAKLVGASLEVSQDNAAAAVARVVLADEADEILIEIPVADVASVQQIDNLVIAKDRCGRDRQYKARAACSTGCDGVIVLLTRIDGEKVATLNLNFQKSEGAYRNIVAVENKAAVVAAAAASAEAGAEQQVILPTLASAQEALKARAEMPVELIEKLRGGTCEEETEDKKEDKKSEQEIKAEKAKELKKEESKKTDTKKAESKKTEAKKTDTKKTSDKKEEPKVEIHVKANK